MKRLFPACFTALKLMPDLKEDGEPWNVAFLNNEKGGGYNVISCYEQ
jgi:hypothetical protein